MRAGVIAAGEGIRLQPDFGSLPKSLIPVHGIPMVEWLLRTLVQATFTHVSIVIREDHYAVSEHLYSLDLPVKLDTIRRNTSGGLQSFMALSENMREEEGFFLFSVDSVFDPSELIRFVSVAEQYSDAYVTTWITERTGELNQVGIEIDHNMIISDFGKQLEDSRYVAEGPYYCRSAVFDLYRQVAGAGLNRLTDYFRWLVQMGHTMSGYYVPTVIDIDDLVSHKRAQAFLDYLKP